MSTLKIKSVEELMKQFDNEHSTFPHEFVKTVITQDRATIHASLVAAVEGKRKTKHRLSDYSSMADQRIEVQKEGYNAALDDTLTIINSIFKE